MVDMAESFGNPTLYPTKTIILELFTIGFPPAIGISLEGVFTIYRFL